MRLAAALGIALVAVAASCGGSVQTEQRTGAGAGGAAGGGAGSGGGGIPDASSPGGSSGASGAAAAGGGPIDAGTADWTIWVDVGPADANPYTSCAYASECAWSEIDHEILTPADCPCLFGCPYLPLNKTTADRRQKQWAALCDPAHDGKGNPCEVDDCIVPPTIQCAAGQCAGPQKDY
jgi:hypothetical protein